MPTFPADQSAGLQSSWQVCLDPLATLPAPIVLVSSGVPVPNSILNAGPDGLWPLYTCAGTQVLYAQDATGRIATIQAIPGAGPAVTITGSRSGGQALQSLIASLAALDINIIDGTSA
jgi:hypothetical protein